MYVDLFGFEWAKTNSDPMMIFSSICNLSFLRCDFYFFPFSFFAKWLMVVEMKIEAIDLILLHLEMRMALISIIGVHFIFFGG